jgi:hypothetical protein
MVLHSNQPKLASKSAQCTVSSDGCSGVLRCVPLVAVICTGRTVALREYQTKVAVHPRIHIPQWSSALRRGLRRSLSPLVHIDDGNHVAWESITDPQFCRNP